MAKASDSAGILGGEIPGETGKNGPAYRLLAPEHPKIPILIAAPHGGRSYPSAALANMRGGELTRIKLEDRYIDEIAVRIAERTGASLLTALAPRAVIDLNRSSEDVDWEMIAGKARGKAAHVQANHRARQGLGLIPRRLPGLGEIWRQPIETRELEARIKGIHKPYHAALALELERIRDHWGAALLIDLHSMPPLKKRYGLAQVARFVVGDRFGESCALVLSDAVLHFLEHQGLSASHNRPYSGGFVLDKHALRSRGIHALQLEVCRSLYLDDAMCALSSSTATALVDTLVSLVRELAGDVAQLEDTRALAQAAE